MATKIDWTCSNPWEIAEELGIWYTGDMNPMPHGGTFYSSQDWAKYGYAECVRIEEVDGRILVECGTINRIDVDSAMKSCGLEHDTPTPEMEIEACLGYWGIEVSEDFSGRYEQWFSPEGEYEDFNEDEIWESISGWILGLV